MKHNQPGQSKRRQSLFTRICRAIAVVCAFAFAIAILGLTTLGLRINSSSSMPLGLYRTTADPNAKTIAFCPAGEASRLSMTRHYRTAGNCPDGGAPILKNVVAGPGDNVDVLPAGLAVNNVLLPNTKPKTHDTAGQPLTAWPLGHYSVPPGYVWVASTVNDCSYDSRYYGPISTKQIQDHLKSVFTIQ